MDANKTSKECIKMESVRKGSYEWLGFQENQGLGRLVWRFGIGKSMSIENPIKFKLNLRLITLKGGTPVN